MQHVSNTQTQTSQQGANTIQAPGFANLAVGPAMAMAHEVDLSDTSYLAASTSQDLLDYLTIFKLDDKYV
jgi:hypothetical protein